MNREIKFRVFNKKTNQLRGVEAIEWRSDGSIYSVLPSANSFDVNAGVNQVSLHDNEYILMQYTGLKDKNGKEIYEGDIVQTEEDGRKIEPAIVVWEIDRWLIYTTQSMIYLHPTDWREYKIIGNIYENPELKTL